MLQNVEQVSFPNQSEQELPIVLKVKAWNPGFGVTPGSGFNEPYALALSDSGFSLARGPELQLSCTGPERVDPDATVDVDCMVSNEGDLEAFDILIAVDFSAASLAVAKTTDRAKAVGLREPVSNQSALDLAPGESANIEFSVTAPSGSGRHVLTVESSSESYGERFETETEIDVDVGTPPAVPTVGGIVSSASFLANAPAAPGSILAVFGQDFGMTNRNFLFPSTQFEDEGISVRFDGTAAPLFGVFGDTPFPQINVLAPTDLPEMGQVQVEVTNAAGTSDMFMLAMAPASTGIYRADPVGRMYAAALVAFDPDVPNRGPTRHLAIPASTAATLGIPTNCKADGVAPLADCGEPVSPGVILQIFVTGLGKATPGGDPAGDPLPAGELAPGGYNTVETPVVTMGGIQAIVDFSGLAPSFSGLYQINARVPLGAQAGDQVPLTIRMPSEMEGDTSNIAIAGP